MFGMSWKSSVSAMKSVIWAEAGLDGWFCCSTSWSTFSPKVENRSSKSSNDRFESRTFAVLEEGVSRMDRWITEIYIYS